jgi:hypothetical protein
LIWTTASRTTRAARPGMRCSSSPRSPDAKSGRSGQPGPCRRPRAARLPLGAPPVVSGRRRAVRSPDDLVRRLNIAGPRNGPRTAAACFQRCRFGARSTRSRRSYRPSPRWRSDYGSDSSERICSRGHERGAEAGAGSVAYLEISACVMQLMIVRSRFILFLKVSRRASERLSSHG